MKTKIKLFMALPHYYQEFEQRLEKYAQEGLILKKIGNNGLIKLEKSEPQNLKYRVAYFKEGDNYNPRLTENQLTYIDYAEESGWDFVCENGKFQVFCTSLENPVELETDEQEKLDNIHKCMKKSLLKPYIILLVVFLFNLIVQTRSISYNPMKFIQSGMDIGFFAMILFYSMFLVYSLINYLWWHKKSQKSIDLGEGIANARSTKVKICDYTIIGLSFISYLYVMFKFLQEINMKIEFIVALIILIASSLGVFKTLKGILKHLKVPAKTNKIISITVCLISYVLCSFGIFTYGYNLSAKEVGFAPIIDDSIRVTKQELPLTCEQLYSKEKADDDCLGYIFEKNITKTIFLKKEEYAQENNRDLQNFPGNTPGWELELVYTIYTTPFGCIKDVILKDILDYLDKYYFRYNSSEKLDNKMFGTEQAYAYYMDTSWINKSTPICVTYLLVYENTIIKLIVDDEQLSQEQANIVQKQLLDLPYVIF